MHTWCFLLCQHCYLLPVVLMRLISVASELAIILMSPLKMGAMYPVGQCIYGNVIPPVSISVYNQLTSLFEL